MKSLILVLLVCFVAISVFGFISMVHGGEHTVSCFAATTQSAPCPKADPVGFANFHLNAFLGFSNFTQAESFNLVSLFIILASLLVLSEIIPHLALPSRPFTARFQEAFTPSIERTFVSWFSLHENSPSAL